MKYSIGEVSKIYGVSIDTLRYYDKIGLLKPNVNSNNGYRYYDMEHIEQLMFILSAKELEIPLSEIREVLDSEDLKKYKKLLIKQNDIIKDKIKYLQKLEKITMNRLIGLEEIINFENNYKFDEIHISKYTKNFYYITLKDLKHDSKLIKILNDIYDERVGVIEEQDIEDIIYNKYKILDNQKIIKDNTCLYIIENKINKDILDKYFLAEKGEIPIVKLEGNYITVKFFGNEKDMNEYILLLKKQFKIRDDSPIYINVNFNLSKKSNTEYFFEILYKI